MTMCTSDSTHSRNRRNRWVYRIGSQVYNSFACRSRAGDSLRSGLADKKTVTRATDILLSWRGISDRLKRWFIKTLTQCLFYWITVASWHCKHFTTCWSFFPETSIKAWQTLQATIGFPFDCKVGVPHDESPEETVGMVTSSTKKKWLSGVGISFKN